MYYTHLTFEQRYHIDLGRCRNLSARVIALKIGVKQSTVYRELKRGCEAHGHYRAVQADERARARARSSAANHPTKPPALAEARQGKRTLKTHTVTFKAAPDVTPKALLRIRQDLKISRALFAAYLRTNVRTLENWEQGRAKPNAQAALLINMVKRYPDTVERLAAI